MFKPTLVQPWNEKYFCRNTLRARFYRDAYIIILYSIYYITFTSTCTCVYILYIILYHPILLADFIIVIISNEEKKKRDEKTFEFVAYDMALNWSYIYIYIYAYINVLKKEKKRKKKEEYLCKSLPFKSAL